MTIYDILEQGVTLGIESDFRPAEEVRSFVWNEEVSDGAGHSFHNFYPDTGIVALSAPLTRSVTQAVVGIDIRTDEMLVQITRAREQGATIDLFISHHPEGRLNVSFPTILYSHFGNLSACGVTIESQRSAYDNFIRTMQSEVLATDMDRVPEAVRALETNYIAIHTPTDNLGARFVEQRLREQRPATLTDVVTTLLGIEEYARYQAEFGVVPLITSGEPSAQLGRFTLVDFTGGEEGPIEVYAEMKKQGVDTALCMHMSKGALEKCGEVGLNVVEAGHMASDSVGLNLFCDSLEQAGVEIIPTAGFVRVSRVA